MTTEPDSAFAGRIAGPSAPRDRPSADAPSGLAARLRGWPLAAKLPAFVALLTFVVALVTTQVALSLAERREDRVYAQAAGIVVDGVRGAVKPYLGDGVAEVERALARKLTYQEGVRVAALQAIWRDQQGNSYTARAVDPRVPDSLASFAARQFTTDVPARGSWQIDGDRGLAVQPAAGPGSAGVRAVIDLAPVNAQRQADRWLFIGIDIALAAFGALIAFLYVRAVLAPVHALTGRLAADTAGAPEPPAPSGPFQPATTEIGKLQRVLADRVAFERERSAALQELAQRERTESLAAIAASLAHEVRNPLAGLLNGVSTLRRYGDDPHVRAQTLDLIDRGLRSIERVATAALSTYRPPDPGRGFTDQDLDDLVTLVAPQARQRGVALRRDGALDRTVAADANAVRQVLLNLLLNAVRASPSGARVRLRVRDLGDAASFDVVDAGDGLPEAIRAFLHGADDGDMPNGQGLGLRTVRRLVDELGGRLSAASQPGGGTTVTVTVVDAGSFEETDRQAREAGV
jgi:signal transduction histidine kinase